MQKPKPGYRPPLFQYPLSYLFGIVTVAGVIAWLGPVNFLLLLGAILYAYVGVLYAATCVSAIFLRD